MEPVVVAPLINVHLVVYDDEFRASGQRCFSLEVGDIRFGC